MTDDDDDDDGFDAPAPSKLKPFKAKKKSQVGRRQSHIGWTLMRVNTKRQIRVYPTHFAMGPLMGKPPLMWWPTMDDWDGARAMVEAVMDVNIDTLYEMTLRFPEHTFGFEVMLTGHDPAKQVAERAVLRVLHLPRDHVLTIDIVRLHDDTIQVRGIITRDAKEIASDIYFDDSIDADDNGMDAAELVASLSQ